MKNITYKILGKEKLNELEDEVNKYIRDRWIPLGGVFVAIPSRGDAKMFFYQTMHLVENYD